MNRHTLVKIYAVITSFGAYIMMMLGVMVTDTDSGQGCGNSWPFCHGQLIPDSMSMSAVYEYSHRISSGADSFLICTLSFVCWLLYRKIFRVKLLSFLSVFFVLLQAALGAVTVVYEGTFAKYPLLALHFGFALISFACVLLLTYELFQLQRQETQPAPRKLRPVLQYTAWGVAAWTYVVVYTGALVQHTGAVSGCGTQFPGCVSYVPTFATLSGVQMIHRYAASSIWLFILIYMLLALKWAGDRRDIIVGSILAFIFVTLQALSGVANVVSSGASGWNIVHTTIISFLFSILCFLCMRAEWPRRKQHQQSVETQVSLGQPEKQYSEQSVMPS